MSETTDTSDDRPKLARGSLTNIDFPSLLCTTPPDSSDIIEDNCFFPKDNVKTLPMAAHGFVGSTNEDNSNDPVLKKVLLDVSEARKDRREREQIEQCMCDSFNVIHSDFVEYFHLAAGPSVAVCDSVTEDRQSWPPHAEGGLFVGPQPLNTNRPFSLPAESSRLTLDVGGFDPFSLDDDYRMTRRRSDETYTARRRLLDEYLSGGPVGTGGSTSFTPGDTILGDDVPRDNVSGNDISGNFHRSAPIEVPSGTQTRGQQHTRMYDVMANYPDYHQEMYNRKPPVGKSHNARDERVCCNRLCGL